MLYLFCGKSNIFLSTRWDLNPYTNITSVKFYQLNYRCNRCYAISASEPKLGVGPKAYSLPKNYSTTELFRLMQTK